MPSSHADNFHDDEEAPHRRLLNQQQLDEARRLGCEMEDVAKGTKFNLQIQSGKLQK